MFQSLEVDDAVLVSVFVHFTLHPRGSKLLTSEKDGVVVVIFIICVLPLLFESPSTHILQTLRRVAQLNETRGLKAYMRRMLRPQSLILILLLASGGGVNQFQTSKLSYGFQYKLLKEQLIKHVHYITISDRIGCKIFVCCSHKPMTPEGLEYSTWVIWMIFMMLCHHWKKKKATSIAKLSICIPSCH